MRILLRVAYDGTAYCGFQSQKNGISIQDVLEDAIEDLFKVRIRTMSASRTDAGVHSLGNVVVFDVSTKIDPSKISLALNARLPEDIRVVESKRVEDDFHPRFRDTIKTYEYRILNRKHPDPLTRLTEMHYYYPMDAERMNEAAGHFEGEHDFRSFCAAGFSSKTTVRRILAASVKRDGDRITFTVTGTGFLYNMVRIMAGTLIEVGIGRLSPDDIPAIIAACDRHAAGPTAIAKGLVLVRIEYP